MSNAKNGVAETTALTGGAGVGQVITLTGAIDAAHPSFQDAYGGAASDIPVAVIVGDDFQTCRCDFNGTNQLTVVSIQSQWKGGVYDDSTPTGITLSGTPIAQVAYNAASLVDSLGGLFSKHAGHLQWVDNAGASPTIDFSTGNNQVASNASVGAITLTHVPGMVLNGQLRIDNPSTVTTIASSGTIYWAGNAMPDLSGTLPVILSVIIDGSGDAWIGSTKDFGDGSVITDWVTTGLAEQVDEGAGATWVNPSNAQAEDGSMATSSGASTTDSLRGTTMGFAIPANATIQGVEIRMKMRSLTGAATVGNFRLWSAGNKIGDTRGDGTAIPSTAGGEWITAGGLSDLWGVALTDTIVNATTFGVGLIGVLNGTGIEVDVIQMRVKYLP